MAYKYEKVAEPSKWRLQHVLNWEREFGELPKGKILIFADGNSMNTDVDNLIPVERSIEAIMNRWGFRGRSREETEALIALAKHRCALSKARKKKKESGSAKKRKPGV